MKKIIREAVLAQRRSLAVEVHIQDGLKAQESLLATAEFQKTASIALYSAVYKEVSTDLIFDTAVRLGKSVAFPRVRRDRLEFIQVADLRDLAPGAFGIPEPSGDRVLNISELQMMVVPGVAFDRNGHRLGYGKGFYDRALHGLENFGILAGLCFEFQILESLPAEGHDVRMDLLCTEKGVLRFGERQLSVKNNLIQ